MDLMGGSLLSEYAATAKAKTTPSTEGSPA